MVDLNFSGQSNARPNPIAGRDFPTRTAHHSAGPPPKQAEHVKPSSFSPLVYPLDTPFHYIKFDVFNYNGSWNMFGSLPGVSTSTGGQGLGSITPAGGPIVLPLSEEILDSLGVRWQETPIAQNPMAIFAGIGQIAKFAANAINPAGAQPSSNPGNNPSAPNAFSQLGQILQQGILQQGNQAMSETVGALAGGGGLVDQLQKSDPEGLLRFAPNQFLTMLFVGPEYKRHRFRWTLSPRTVEETNILRNIIQIFKVSMSPTIEYNVLWGWPLVFKPAIMVGNQENYYLYQFKFSVINDFSVLYTPGGRPSFYHKVNGTIGPGGAPEGVTIQATFTELEYWVRDKNNPSQFLGSQTTVQGS
jgi:hypothetical protein